MLRHLSHRLVSPTIIYLGFTLATWTIRDAVNAKLIYLALALGSVYYASLVWYAVDYERRLDALGSRTVSRQSWTPFNIGILLSAIWHVTHHRNHEWWWKIFGHDAKRQSVEHLRNPWNAESITIGQRIIFTSDEENIKAVLASQFQDYGKGAQFQKEWNDFLGFSIFTTDGEMWHNSRSLLRPQFIKDRVSDLRTFEKHVSVLKPLLAGSHNGATVRLDDLLFRYTLDAVTDFLLGNSVESLKGRKMEFFEAFAEVQRVQGLISRAGPVQMFIPRKSFRRSLRILNSFVEQYIDQALQLTPEELEKKTKTDEGYNFLYALASYTRERAVLRDQLVAVLLAGRDTTATTLSWLFYELSKHPEVVQKLRQEIMRFVGPDAEPTYTNLKDMRYLQHTLNEILRIYPAVPYNVRVALTDTTLPTGGGPNGDEPIAVLKDTPIGYSTYVMQHRSDIYPPTSTGFPDPEEFVPERWDNWIPKSWTYIPFNGGPRICIGQQFALTEMAYTTVRILQTYARIENRNDGFPMLRSDIILQPAHGIKVAFFREEKQYQ